MPDNAQFLRILTEEIQSLWTVYAGAPPFGLVMDRLFHAQAKICETCRTQQQQECDQKQEAAK